MQPVAAEVLLGKRTLPSIDFSFGAVTTVLLAITVGAVAAWGPIEPWSQDGAPLLMTITGIAALLALAIARNFARVPYARSTWPRLGVIVAAFVLLFAVFAVFRFYYSRTFLLVSFLVVAGMDSLSNRWRHRRPVVGLIPGSLANACPELPLADVRLLNAPSLDGVDAVAVDLHEELPPHWLRFLADCSVRGVPVVHIARLVENATGRVSLEHFSEQLEFGPSAVYSVVRRWLEVALILVTLPIWGTLALLTAIAVRLDSPGPVLFIQERVGLGGKPFKMLKFRSMRVGADASGAKFAADRDPRVTAVGRFIRKFRLDELPQLINVLQGSMSLIGPRPEQVAFVRAFSEEIPYYNCRHLVKPGLTGWAQVVHGYAADKDATRIKLEHDLFYVKNQSPKLDLLVFFLTLRTILTGFGAR